MSVIDNGLRLNISLRTKMQQSLNELLANTSAFRCSTITDKPFKSCGSGDGLGRSLIRRSVVWSRLLQCACQSIHGQDSEPQIALDCSAISVRAWGGMSRELMWDALDGGCCIAPDEQVGTLHGSLCHHCMNMCENADMGCKAI